MKDANGSASVPVFSWKNTQAMSFVDGRGCVGDVEFRIDAADVCILIPISEDKPNEVKSAFNKVITRVKRGVFQIELEDVGEDLFSQVANEYITQLNREIQEVHGEMEEYGLVED